MAFWVTRPRQSATVPLPTDWTVSARAVFSVDERRAYRQLRDAFPQYIVLAKLPLIRFCQPADPKEIQYWFELLGGIHVSFAVCSAHGRVLATIDLDSERPPARRTQEIKQSVLAACRIRYLRCTIEHLPTQSELQMLLPTPGPSAATNPSNASTGESGRATANDTAGSHRGERAAVPAARGDTLPGALAVERPARPDPASPVSRTSQPPVSETTASSTLLGGRAADSRQRKERKALWQDSGLFQDSFFGIDNLRDAGPQSSLGSLLRETRPGGLGASTGQSGGDMLESERMKSPPKSN